ncbi:putative S-layer protein [Paenibacillus agaridevorans]|uniref:Putative S-layer protein n=1 Tax=Paenibacillus agaridevorans TaxID=171404 RepID=A0A2R5ERE7_9BACL|nr:putative S-layer protein [Paenibacillus agaridevorans]
MYDGGSWAGWIDFKVRVAAALNPPIVTPEPEQPIKPVDDITGHWGEAAIREAIKDGALVGFPDSTLRPDEPLTRAQYAVIERKPREIFLTMTKSAGHLLLTGLFASKPKNCVTTVSV